MNHLKKAESFITRIEKGELPKLFLGHVIFGLSLVIPQTPDETLLKEELGNRINLLPNK